jgi:23S rRNA pseudouridine955/2504/2580 synthase
MREIVISKNEEGQRLNKFLLKYLNQATSSFVYKMLRKKNIVLNDKKAKGDEILALNDSVKLYLAEETIDKFRNFNGRDLHNNLHNSMRVNTYNKSPESAAVEDCGSIRILYENEHMLAIHKPAGILSQKANIRDYSVNDFVLDYCREKGVTDGSTFKPSIANRLDRNTSGIILAGISLKGSQKLARAFKERQLEKFYYTIVKGVMRESIHATGYIHKDYPENKSKVIDKKSYDRLSAVKKKNFSFIDTEFYPRAVSEDSGYTLLKVKLNTGKSHQIRAQLNALGFYVLGDNKYGELSENQYLRKKYGLKYHLLHSGELIMDEEVFGEKLVIKDGLPEVFARICKGENIPWVHGIPED